MSNNNNEDTVTILDSTSPEVIGQMERAQVDTQIATARAFPRDMMRAMNNALDIVTMDEETAASCTYSVPRGGKIIIGASVHCARILAQTWGNINIGARIVAIDEKHVTSHAICWDLENNVRFAVEVKKSILQNEYLNGRKTGGFVRMNEDMIVVTGNAANAISLRNAILNVIPKSIIEKVHKAAKQKITGDISSESKLNEKRLEIFLKLKTDYSVTEKEILSSIGKAQMSNVTADDVFIIMGVIQALKDGDTNVADAFRNGIGEKVKLSADEIKKRQAEQKKRISSLIAEIEEHIPANQIEGLKRIVKKNETTGYGKAEAYLTALKNKLPAKNDK